METTTYIAVSRQSAIFGDLSTIANNVANASTVGYRAERTLFQEYLQRTGTAGHRDSMSFSQDIGQFRDTRQGPLTTTSNQLDLALIGKGYFVIGSPGEQFFSRIGAFRFNDQSQMVTAEGYPILDTAGQPITLPNDGRPIRVTSDGAVSSGGNQIATIQVVEFADDQALRRTQNGVYATDQQSTPSPGTQVVQGALEASNVQPIFELTRLIEVSRQYDNTQKLISDESERQKNMMKALIG